MQTVIAKPLRDTLRVDLIFTRPVFEWQSVPGRFFKMIYENLSSKIPVNVPEFTVQPSASLSEVWAKYRIYGGASSVTIHPEKLAFEVPNMLPPEYPVALDIIRTIHDAFPTTFSELNYGRVEVLSLSHLDLSQGQLVTELLGRHAVSEVQSAFNKFVIVQDPGIKFGVIAQDQTWQCNLVAERSLLSVTAVFVASTISLRNVTAVTPFLDKLALAQELGAASLRAIGLELQDGTAPQRT